MKNVPFLVIVLLGCSSPRRLEDRGVALARWYDSAVVEALGTRAAVETVRVRVAGLPKNTLARTDEERGTITLSPRIAVLPDDILAWTIIHELVHLHATGPWDNLPPWLEEGVAEHVACTILPRLAPTLIPYQTPDYREAHEFVEREGLRNIQRQMIALGSNGSE